MRAFDLNSALAGATSTANLIDTMYYKPQREQRLEDEHKQRMEKGAIDLKQSNLQFNEQEKAIKNNEELLAGYKAKANLLTLNQALEAKNFREADRTLVFAMSDPGTQSFIKKTGVDPSKMRETLGELQAGQQAWRNMMSTGSTSPEDILTVRNSLAKAYANTTVDDVDSKDISVEYGEDNKVTVRHKNRVIDRFDSPTDAAKMFDRDIKKLAELPDMIDAYAVGLGDKDARASLNKKYDRIKDITAARKLYTSPEAVAIINAASIASDDRAAVLLKEASDYEKNFKTSKASIEVDKIIASKMTDLGKLTSKQKNKLDYVANNIDAWKTEILNDPAIQTIVAATGMNPTPMIDKQIQEKFKNQISVSNANAQAVIANAQQTKAASTTKATLAEQNAELRIQSTLLVNKQKEIKNIEDKAVPSVQNKKDLALLKQQAVNIASKIEALSASAKAAQGTTDRFGAAVSDENVQAILKALTTN